MNKTIIININSIVFHIEEDAYENLRTYMIEIKKHFGKSEDSKEILEDIENRIAEMFSERIQLGRKEVINMEDVTQVISQMGRVSDFETEILTDDNLKESIESDPTDFHKTSADAGPENNADEPDYSSLIAKKLMRDMDDKVLGGVCSGLGHYFNIESKWIRIIFVLFFLFGGSGVILYFVLWAIMPKAQNRADKLSMRGEKANLQNFKKSFDEEMKGIRENFSGTGEHINRGARSIGDGLGRLFSSIGKILAVLILVATGFTLIGLFVVLVLHVLNIMGFQNDVYFPPLEVLQPTGAFFAVLAGTLAIGIPFLALFFFLLRLVFKTKPMNNYASMTLLASWIVSIVLILYFVISTNQEFQEVSTISVEKQLAKKETFIFSENDMRVIKASDEDFTKKKFNLYLTEKGLSEVLRGDISIQFEAIDSLKNPYLQYNYHAKGKTYSEASERASKISYLVNQQGDHVIFNSHFSINKGQLYRDQRVAITAYLPVGTKVLLAHELDHKVRDIWAHDCKGEQKNYSEWIMQKDGFKCIQKLKEEKEKALQESLDEKEKVEEQTKEGEAAEKTDQTGIAQRADATNAA